mmetsp:Transcript_13102/g.17264  ORF Transcript_13102/g.17264 Transcript_13102/m.17264 type:complete len:266 (+) Transcript_13102:80-877(+)
MEEDIFMVTEPYSFHIGKDGPYSAFGLPSKKVRGYGQFSCGTKEQKKRSVSSSSEYVKAKRLISEKFWNLHISKPAKKNQWKKYDPKKSGKRSISWHVSNLRRNRNSNSFDSRTQIPFPFQYLENPVDQRFDQVIRQIRRSAVGFQSSESQALVLFTPQTKPRQQSGEGTCEVDGDAEMHNGLSDVTFFLADSPIRRTNSAVEINSDSDDIVEVPRDANQWVSQHQERQERSINSFSQALSNEHESCQSSGETSSSFKIEYNSGG